MLSRSLWCSTDSLSHPVVQNFVPALASIFTSVKDSELKECKIPLLFIEDDYVGGDRKRLHQGQAPGRPRECPEKL